MKLARNSSSLFEHEPELLSQRSHPKLPNACCHCGRDGDAHRVEPSFLVECRFNYQGQRGRGLIKPIQTSAHQKAVCARRQPRIESLVARSGIDPISIKSFEFVTEPQLRSHIEICRAE